MLQKYMPTILSAALLVLGGLQVLIQTGANLVTILQFVALLITTATTFQLRGRWKIGLEIAGVLVAAVLPFAIDQTFTKANIVLILIAIVKALATHFGIQVRQDAESATADQVQVVPLPEPGGDESGRAVVLDDDEPKHLATS
jgi:hypothetical protein